jgi:DNA helicase-2/ATP-dependent DNA helicase PcrA
VLDTEGPSMILAGAGSGKTRVLVYRVIYLIKYLNINPSNLLVLTFTNKAANEMVNRLSYYLGIDNCMHNLYIGTFHAIFSQLLRVYSKYLNYSNDYMIYDRQDCQKIVKIIINDMNLDSKLYNVNTILSKISLIKNYSSSVTDSHNICNRLNINPIDVTIYQKYIDKCFDLSIMDFDDLIIKTKELFDNNLFILSKYQKRFKYILVDEFQDTNMIQYSVLKSLSYLYNNICVVGDDCQSIYSFRGANDNMMRFKKDYPNVKIFFLNQNYRSTYNIVGASNDIISNNKHKINKKLWTNNIYGEKITIIKSTDNYNEALLVAENLLKVKKKYNLYYSDFAVLYRYNTQAVLIENAFQKKNILYHLYSGSSSWNNKNIKSILFYFRLIININDDYALSRIINYPIRGIGLITFNKLINYSNKVEKSIFHILNNIDSIYRRMNISKSIMHKLKQFYCCIMRIRSQINNLNAYEITDLLLNEINIKNISQDEKFNLFIQNIKDYVYKNNRDKYLFQNQDISLISFFNHIQLYNNLYLNQDSHINKVSLMTIHMSKGLEFKVVFIIGLQEGFLPSFISIKEHNIEEERRLFYVALTRAKFKVFLSYSILYYNNLKSNKIYKLQLSRFLYEISGKYLDGNNIHNLSIYDKKIHGSFSALVNNIEKYDSHNNKFRVGMIVVHKIFGKGVILNIYNINNNEICLVKFSNYGVKKMLSHFLSFGI